VFEYGNIYRIKPDYQLLIKHGFMPVDMHVHTNYSDSNLSLDSLVKIAKKYGIGFSVTDHNDVRANAKLANHKNVLTIPGIEVTSRNYKDILLYFYDVKELIEFYEKYIKNNKIGNRGFNLNSTSLSIAEIFDSSLNYNCVRVLAHAYTKTPKHSARYFLLDKKLLKKLDCVEALNATLEKWRNANAVRFARKVNKPIVGGSDSHTERLFGSVVTCTNALTTEEFLDYIKRGKSFIVGKELSFFNRAITNAIIFKNNFWLSRKKLNEQLFGH